jgi:cell division protein FtsW (lipid II flippase)/cell division protein FtsI/penicillin-binding protein 2
VSVSERDARGAVDVARRLDWRHALLAASSLVAAAAIAMAFLGQPSVAGGVNLNALKSADLEALLARLSLEPADRRSAATHLHQFVASRQEAGSSLPNVGALLEARADVDGTVRPVLTRAQLAAIKPFAVVRTHEEHRARVALWAAVYFASVWAVALIWWLRGSRGDVLLLSAAHLLTALGFAALLSRQDPLRDTELFVRFAQTTAGGLVLYGLVSTMSLRTVGRIGLTYLPLAGALGLSLLLVVFGSGPAGSGARVNLGPMQPVEFIRLLLALFLAGYFARRWEVLRGSRGQTVRTIRVPAWLDVPRVDYVLPVAAGVAAALLLFFLQKDLGPALFLSSVFLITFAVARNGVGVAAAGFATLVAGFYAGYALNISTTLTARVAMWRSTWDNAVRGGEQIAQAIWGLSTGGAAGAGLGRGQTEYLPAGFTDLMLTAIGEELGFAGLLAVAALVAVIVMRGFRAALRAPDDYSFFLAIVLTLFLALPVLVVTAGMLGLVPLTGVVTPFLSYGGSAMLSNFAALGVLTSIARQPPDAARTTAPFRAGVSRLAAGLSVAAIVLLAVLFDVQVLRADSYVVTPHLGLQSDGYRRFQYNPRVIDLLATLPRGTVYDRGGLPLATSDPDVAGGARDAYRRAGLDAGCTLPLPERCYPLGGPTFHLLGDARSARNWTASNTAYIERDLQDRLRGFDDHATTITSSSGAPVSAVRRDYGDLVPLLRHRHNREHTDVQTFLARPRDVTLTIDAPLQASVARILSKYAERSPTGRAAAVVLDPDTGELLAIGSYPFPSMECGSGCVQDLTPPEAERVFDRARFGLYPPGSTFKLVTAAAALRLDPRLASARFRCSHQPSGRVGATVHGFGPVRDDVLDTRPHGSIDMHDGLVSSCNAYFAQLAVRMGTGPIAETTDLLGISVSRDGSTARLRSTLPHVGYGQGDVVASPLRMARVAAAIAGNGILRNVRLEAGQAADAGQVLLTPDAARTLRGYLRDAVLNGTGRGLREHRWRIAGKTGTAEVGGARSHAWFVGYAPHGAAARRVAFAVLIENAGYGGMSAAPAAAEIVDAAGSRGLIR